MGDIPLSFIFNREMQHTITRTKKIISRDNHLYESLEVQFS